MKLSWFETAFASATVAAGGIANYMLAIEVAGVVIEREDLTVTIALSSVAAFIAAVDTQRGWRAVVTNTVLGALVGFLLAHLIVLQMQWTPGALYSLSPLLSLLGAKVGRMLIRDDEALDELVAVIKAWLKRRLAGGQ